MRGEGWEPILSHLVSFHPAHSGGRLSCDLNVKAKFVSSHHGNVVLAAGATGVQEDLGRIFHCNQKKTGRKRPFRLEQWSFFVFYIWDLRCLKGGTKTKFTVFLFYIWSFWTLAKNTRGIWGFYIWSSIILYCLKPNKQVGAFVYSMAFQSCEHFQHSHSSIHYIFLNCFIEDSFVLHFIKRSHNFENKTESKEQLNSS